MKHPLLILILLGAFLAACDDDDCNHEEEIVLKDTVVNVVEDYKFKIYPTAHNQIRIYIDDYERGDFELVLNNNTEEEESIKFQQKEDRENLWYVDFTTSFPSLSSFPYRIMIRRFVEKVDKIEEEFFFIDYRHQFEDPLVTEKLVDTKHLLDIDFSPNRNVMYFQDYVSNKRILKRLWLEDNKVDVLQEDFFSSLIRAKDNDHLIIETKDYNGRYLDKDSIALLEYDVNTKESTFLAWANDDGFKSRIINNSIFVTDPNTNMSCIKIDLADKSQESYPKTYWMNKNRFDVIQHGNEVYNFETSGFEEPLPFLPESSSIQYVDEATQTYFVLENASTNIGESKLRLLVYRDGKTIFETEYGPRSINIPYIPQLKDDKMILYQRFDFSSDINYDGYYELDLKNKTLKLIQADNDIQYTYLFNYFVGDDNSWFITTRLDGIYKVSRKYIKD